MQLHYLCLSCGVSLSLAGILAVAAVRWENGKERKNRNDIFSASLGIMILICVKSILIDCGWGFAALFGMLYGWAAQLVMTGGAFLFFRQLKQIRDNGNEPADGTALFCFLVGRNLLCDYAVVRDISLYLLGEAAEAAVLITAAVTLRNSTKPYDASEKVWIAFGLLTLKTAACAVMRSRADFTGEFAGLVLLTVGVAGLVCLFAEAISQGREISVGGFAAGFTSALCVTVLFG